MASNQMMEIIESGDLVDNATILVDLMKLARKFLTTSSTPIINCFNEDFSNRFTILVDSECCLDRLYGGFYSDWTCGGQWNKTYQFLMMLMNQADKSNIRFIAAFSGHCYKERFQDWVDDQLECRNRGNKVFNLINSRGIPPPKVWWLAPSCLRTVLRLCFRSLNIPMLCTIEDHQLELAHYVHDLKLNGLMSDSKEFLLFTLPHYFSAKSLKLTLKGSLECKEYLCSKLFSSLNLSKDKMCVLNSLLGNHILRRDQLDDIYEQNINHLLLPCQYGNRVDNIKLMKLLKKEKVKGGKDSDKDDKKYFVKLIRVLADYVRKLDSPITNMDNLMAQLFQSTSPDPRISLMEKSISYYLQGTKEFAAYAHARLSLKSNDENECESSRLIDAKRVKSMSSQQNGYVSDENNVDGANASSNLGCNTSDYESMPSSAKSSNSRNEVDNSSLLSVPKKRYDAYLKNFKKPDVCPEVLKIVNDRCKRGLMSSVIYNILINGEVRLPYVLEEECHFEFPPIHTIYKSIRQMMYAVLFNLNHLKFMALKNNVKENDSDILIKEWVWSINNQYEYPEIVKATPLDWGVPTLKRLWFGVEPEDKSCRMRAFLSIMKAEEPILLNQFYVPSHLLIMSIVLRYLINLPNPILRKYELDAILVHCFSRDLTNCEFIQNLKLAKITSRSVQLASLLMQGIETAIIVNDACGSPLPWNICAPWLYFDGKLLHFILSKASDQTALPALCNNDLETVLKVERIRKAICTGVGVNFPANSPFLPHNTYSGTPVNQPMVPPNCLPPLKLPSNRNSNRNTTFSRGGQLQIAGVVVGSWGPNYNFSHSNRYQASMYSKDGGYYSSSNKKIYPKPHIGPASSSTTRPNQYDKGTTKTKKKKSKSKKASKAPMSSDNPQTSDKNEKNVSDNESTSKIATTTVTTVTVTNQISTEIIKKTEAKESGGSGSGVVLSGAVIVANVNEDLNNRDRVNVMDINNCTLFKSQQPIILKPNRNQIVDHFKNGHSVMKDKCSTNVSTTTITGPISSDSNS